MKSAIPPPWRQAAARIAHHSPRDTDHRWLDLDLPADFPRPSPGQFVQILLPGPAPALLPRPMSVAAASRGRISLRLGFLYAVVGPGTRALAALGVGRAVAVLGPLGRGFPLEVPGTPVLIAGGRGVSPLMFAAAALAAGGRRCEFIYGARTRHQLVGLDEARTRFGRMGARLHLATEDGSRGLRGTTVECLAALAPRWRGPLVLHACGPHAMLRAVARWGLEHGVPTFVAMESAMACGTGVCRGCALPRSETARAAYDETGAPSLCGNRDYALCCTEGPVFAAGELDWERIG